MPQVIVRINDRPYTMMCNEGEQDHLAELAAFLDNEVSTLKQKVGQVGDSRLLLMASLVVADKLSEALRRIEGLQEEIDGLKDARKKQDHRGFDCRQTRIRGGPDRGAEQRSERGVKIETVFARSRVVTIGKSRTG